MNAWFTSTLPQTLTFSAPLERKQKNQHIVIIYWLKYVAWKPCFEARLNESHVRKSGKALFIHNRQHNQHRHIINFGWRTSLENSSVASQYPSQARNFSPTYNVSVKEFVVTSSRTSQIKCFKSSNVIVLKDSQQFCVDLGWNMSLPLEYRGWMKKMVLKERYRVLTISTLIRFHRFFKYVCTFPSSCYENILVSTLQALANLLLN